MKTANAQLKSDESGFADTSSAMDHFDLAEHLRVYQGQIDLRAEFLQFLGSDPKVFHREHGPGHFTASCWLLSADHQRVLLTHHKKLGRWLQLGGHADGERNLAAVALQEAYEESGLQQLRLNLQPFGLEQGAIFDLDAHVIPARPAALGQLGADPEHVHWDVRFVIEASGSQECILSDESHALAWVPITELAADPKADASLQRMAQKWLGRS